MKKRLLAILLTATMSLGLHISATAHNVPDFTDVPADHWAYEPIMEMTEQGVMKGVGANRFDPNGKLTAEMFIVMIGRVLHPSLTAAANDWSRPYIARAKEEGLLQRTTITDETVKNEITRYDVVNILYNTNVVCVMNGSTRAQLEEVSDEGELEDLVFYREFDGEHMLADWESISGDKRYYVGAIYLAGLMCGDQDRNFNGDGTLTRMEAATVLQRFVALWEKSSLARQQKVERAERELRALSTEPLSDLSPAELEDLLFLMDDTSSLDVFEMMNENYGYFADTKQRGKVLERIGVPQEDFDAAYNAAKQRKWDLTRLKEYLGEDVTIDTLASVAPEKLKSAFWYVQDHREEQEIVSLMRDFGATAADMEAVYREVYESAPDMSVWKGQPTTTEKVRLQGEAAELRRETLRAAGELARVAAIMAKAEGKATFTILANGGRYLNEAIGPHDFYKEDVQLGLYGEDGRLIGRPRLRYGDTWEMEVEINTDNLDETFRLKLLEPFVIERDRYDYHVLTEDTHDVSGDIKELVQGMVIGFRGTLYWK